MEYLNITDFCSSSASIWLRITFVIMFLYCFVRLSKFIWGLRFKLVHHTSNSSKTRKKANRKKNRAHKKLIPDNLKCLDWETRKKIVVGVAKALRYLHNEMKTPILHCYIHPSNIWLDENCNPKLSAYGVVRLYYPAKRSMFSTFMIGSYYYTIHDHRLTKKVTIQADIYGFGIFLLEIITGRIGRIVREDGVAEYLIDWVQPYLKDKAKLAEIVDSRLGGNFKEEELYEVCNIAEMCLKKEPSARPPMADLVTRMSHFAE